MANYFVVEMPINSDGDGPEMDASAVVQVLYEVWDENFLSHAEFDRREDAEEWIQSQTY